MRIIMKDCKLFFKSLPFYFSNLLLLICGLCFHFLQTEESSCLLQWHHSFLSSHFWFAQPVLLSWTEFSAPPSQYSVWKSPPASDSTTQFLDPNLSSLVLLHIFVSRNFQHSWSGKKWHNQIENTDIIWEDLTFLLWVGGSLHYYILQLCNYVITVIMSVLWNHFENWISKLLKWTVFKIK